MGNIKLNKYIIIFLSALVLEVGSTMYISSVSDKMVGSTMFWAFVGPFIALPFAGFVADEKTWRGSQGRPATSWTACKYYQERTGRRFQTEAR